MAEIPFSLGSLTKTSEGWATLAAPTSIAAVLFGGVIPTPGIIAENGKAMAVVFLAKLVIFGLSVISSQWSYVQGRSRVKEANGK